MKVACSPRVVVPLVLGIGIIAVLLGYANVGRVLQAASAFQPHYFLLILLFTLAYEALRAVQWLLFLRVLNHRKAWRGCLMSFMGGEMAKVLPGGQYFQTYLLRQAQGLPMARSAAATTIIIWLEVGAGLVIPVPVDLGLTELSGLAALMALGAPQADALTVMLLQRVLSSTLTGGISLAGLAALRRHVAAALHPRQLATSSRIRPVARRAELRGTTARRPVCG